MKNDEPEKAEFGITRRSHAIERIGIVLRDPEKLKQLLRYIPFASDAEVKAMDAITSNSKAQR